MDPRDFEDTDIPGIPLDDDLFINDADWERAIEPEFDDDLFLNTDDVKDEASADGFDNLFPDLPDLNDSPEERKRKEKNARINKKYADRERQRERERERERKQEEKEEEKENRRLARELARGDRERERKEKVVCDVCHTAVTRPNMRRHKQCIHIAENRKERRGSKYVAPPAVPIEGAPTCDICGYQPSCRRTDNLRRHLLQVHDEGYKDDRRAKKKEAQCGENCFECKICGEEFKGVSAYSNWLRHMKCHREKGDQYGSKKSKKMRSKKSKKSKDDQGNQENQEKQKEKRKTATEEEQLKQLQML